MLARLNSGDGWGSWMLEAVARSLSEQKKKKKKRRRKKKKKKKKKKELQGSAWKSAVIRDKDFIHYHYLSLSMSIP